MSIRAYKLIEIKHDEDETFNLSHDEELVEALGVFYKDGLNDDGCGIIEFSLSELKRVKKEHKFKDKESEKTLKKMIKDAEGDEYVQYYCF